MFNTRECDNVFKQFSKTNNTHYIGHDTVLI